MSIASEITRMLTAKADIKTAIEAKGVTVPSSATLDEFSDYIDEISGGGGEGGDIDALLDGSITTLTSNTTKICNSGLVNRTSLKSLYLPNCLQLENSGALQGCTNLETLSIPVCTYIGSNATNNDTKLTTLIAPKIQTINAMGLKSIRVPILCFPEIVSSLNSSFEQNTALTTVDFGATYVGSGGFYNYAFNGCTSFNTLILRTTNEIVVLRSTNAFQNTPFASGKAGGTLYVPSALISEYQAATNWSTILGYTNNNIVAIEGSQYETAYADGTPISA